MEPCWNSGSRATRGFQGVLGQGVPGRFQFQVSGFDRVPGFQRVPGGSGGSLCGFFVGSAFWFACLFSVFWFCFLFPFAPLHALALSLTGA